MVKRKTKLKKTHAHFVPTHEYRMPVNTNVSAYIITNEYHFRNKKPTCSTRYQPLTGCQKTPSINKKRIQNLTGKHNKIVT